jgi:serine/threonine-protein kinase
MSDLLLNRYEIVKSIGSGRFGETFLARDRQITPSISKFEASQRINNLYGYLSNKDFDSAGQLYSPTLQNGFNSNFFEQFDRVTVENLEIISNSVNSISFIGSNTYYYYDGTSQREKRSYEVSLLNGEAKIVESKFIKVTKSRK